MALTAYAKVNSTTPDLWFGRFTESQLTPAAYFEQLVDDGTITTPGRYVMLRIYGSGGSGGGVAYTYDIVTPDSPPLVVVKV